MKEHLVERGTGVEVLRGVDCMGGVTHGSTEQLESYELTMSVHETRQEPAMLAQLNQLAPRLLLLQLLQHKPRILRRRALEMLDDTIFIHRCLSPRRESARIPDEGALARESSPSSASRCITSSLPSVQERMVPINACVILVDKVISVRGGE